MADLRAKNREARIEVVPAGTSLEVRLIDVSGGGAVLAQSPAGDAFENGFADLLQGGQALTAKALIAAYETQSQLADRRLFGKYLYRLLTPNGVGAAWKNLRDEGDDTDRSLTTLLKLPPAWQALPWELLYEGKHLFADRRHAMGLSLGEAAAKNPGCRWPLRLLVIVGCAEDDEKIKWKEELLAIRRAIAAFSLRIELTVERAPTSKQRVGDLISRLRPHFLHFIGHGEAKNGGTLLLMEAGGNAEWTRDEIAITLSDLGRQVPRLAFINACQSAGAQGMLGDTSVAEAFSNIGCPAVLVMRGDIPGATASAFAKSFYQGLAEVGAHRVDQAYNRALGAVGTAQGLDQRAWSLPRIYFRDTAAQVFPLDGENRGFEAAGKGFTDLTELKPFVDRDDHRFELFHRIDCWLDAPEPEFRALVVEGPEKSGKTWLLKAIVYVAKLRGLHAVYRDFQEGHFELEDFLALLRGGATIGKPFLSGPLVEPGTLPNPFEEFDQAPPFSGLSGNEDHKLPLAERFARGLKKAAENAPLLVAFDHVDKLQTCWKYIRAPLFEAATRGSDAGGLGANLRVVIAADADDLATLGLDTLAAKRLRLGSLPPETFEDYVLQYCLHHLPEGSGFEQQLSQCDEIIRSMARNRILNRKNWELKNLSSILDSLGVI